MIDSIELINIELQRSIVIDQDESDFVLETIDWGTANADHNTYNFPEQVGSTRVSSKIGDREITITGYVIGQVDLQESATMTFDEYIQAQVVKIEENKKILNVAINPLQQIKLNAGSYYIFGNPQECVKYSNSYTENNEVMCNFSVTLTCFDPMFNTDYRKITVLSGSEPLFHFPLIIPEDEGLIFGIRTDYKLISVENNGSIEKGANIIIKALGVVNRPRIENAYTNEYIQLSRVMQKDEVIIINTEKGHRSIKGYKGGAEENYFKYWEHGSSWIQFPVGFSLIGYSEGGVSSEVMDVSVDMQIKVFAMEDQ